MPETTQEPARATTIRDVLPKNKDRVFGDRVEEIIAQRTRETGQSRDEVRQEIKVKIEKIREESKKLQKRGILLQTKFFSALENSPEISSQEMLEVVFANDTLTQEESSLILKVKHEFDEMRAATTKLYDALEKKALSNVEGKKRGNASDGKEQTSETELANEMGRLLFLVISGKEPTGPVKLIKNPFVLAIEPQTSEDFSIISNNENPVGSYKDPEHGLQLKKIPLKNYVKLGLGILSASRKPQHYIAIGKGSIDLRSEIAVEHEKQHAINQIVAQALKNTAIGSELWNEHYLETDKEKIEFYNETIKNMNAFFSSYTRGEINKDEFKSGILNSIPDFIDYCFTHSKDEAMASILSLRRHLTKTLSIDRNHLSSSYNYLAILHITPEYFSRSAEMMSVYTEIASEYNKIIKQNTQPIDDLLNLCQMTNTEEIMKPKIIAFMQQNPLSTWGKRVKDVFSDEIARMQETSKIKNELDGAFSGLDLISDSILQKFDTISDQGLVSQLQQPMSELRKEITALKTEVGLKSKDDTRPDFNQIKLFNSKKAEKLPQLMAQIAELEEKAQNILAQLETKAVNELSDILEQIDRHPVHIFFEINSKINSVNESSLKNSLSRSGFELRRVLASYPPMERFTGSNYVNTLSKQQATTDSEAYKNLYPEVAQRLEQTVLPLYQEHNQLDAELSELFLQLDDLDNDVYPTGLKLDRESLSSTNKYLESLNEIQKKLTPEQGDLINNVQNIFDTIQAKMARMAQIIELSKPA